MAGRLTSDVVAARWMRSFHLWPARVVERRGTVDVLAVEAGTSSR